MFFCLDGLQTEVAKKILGMSYRLFASLVGAFFFTYGIVDLVAGAQILLSL
jgi:hypothetical protein